MINDQFKSSLKFNILGYECTERIILRSHQLIDMVRVKPTHVLLYLIGVSFFVLGNRKFWDKIQEEEKKKEQERKKRERAYVESFKKFEIQNLMYDSVNRIWKNNHISFQRIHIEKVSFSPMSKINMAKTETNDDENASESL
ncbi:MAG: hypothetical protein FDW93_00195 [Bergeyella sp.]|nr:hypothetical protein [Bergeyella sp.]